MVIDGPNLIVGIRLGYFSITQCGDRSRNGLNGTITSQWYALKKLLFMQPHAWMCVLYHFLYGTIVKSSISLPLLVLSLVLGFAGSLHGQAPSINSGGIVNLADYTDAIAPGSLISIFGSNLATNTVATQSFPLPTQLGGVTVSINNLSLALLYVSPRQINAQVPSELRPDQYGLQIKVNGQTARATITVRRTGPALFATADGHAIAVTGGSLNTAANPTDAGDVMVFYATGLGAVSPSVTTGDSAPANPPATTSLETVVRIGGVKSEVLFAGLAPGFAGLYQINVRVPATMETGEVPVKVQVGNIESQSKMFSVRSGNSRRAQVVLSISSSIYFPATIYVNGRVVGTAGAQRTTTLTPVVALPFQAAYEPQLPRVTGSGRLVGDPMTGGYEPIDNPNGATTLVIDNTLGGQRYFAPQFTNSSGSALLIGANMGTAQENRCYCSYSAGSHTPGYYLLSPASNFRMYVAGYNYQGQYKYFGSDPSSPGATLVAAAGTGQTNLGTITQSPAAGCTDPPGTGYHWFSPTSPPFCPYIYPFSLCDPSGAGTSKAYCEAATGRSCSEHQGTALPAC